MLFRSPQQSAILWRIPLQGTRCRPVVPGLPGMSFSFVDLQSSIFGSVIGDHGYFAKYGSQQNPNLAMGLCLIGKEMGLSIQTLNLCKLKGGTVLYRKVPPWNKRRFLVSWKKYPIFSHKLSQFRFHKVVYSQIEKKSPLCAQKRTGGMH